MRIALALFIVVPLLEMIVLIRVGGIIGALPTVGLVVLTAAIGLALIKREGLYTLARAQTRLQRGEMPAQELVDAVCLAVGGALLLTPGFVTDALGFMLLIPLLRRLLLHGLAMKILKNASFASAGFSFQQSAHRHQSSNLHHSDREHKPDSNTIDGEFTRED